MNSTKPSPTAVSRGRLLRPSRSQAYQIYLLAVSSLGAIVVLLGLLDYPGFERKLNFVLLLLLAALSQISTTSVQVSKKAGITFEVGSAVTLAAIPIFGPGAAAVIAAVASLSIWIFKSHDKTTWKRSWQQLAFNTGMWSLSMYLAGSAMLAVRASLAANVALRATVPWLIAAIINDQLNLWLLIIMLRLQHGAKINPWDIWRKNLWAAIINVLVMSVGGGFLAFAVEQFDWTGIVIFFLPIMLSAYAFRLYVRQMKAHMDNLENIVAERTHELAQVNREKDAFLAVLTHDMKTPLASINIYASLLRDHPELALKKPHMAETILNSQKALLDMVNNILDLEKLQSNGSIPLQKAQLDLCHLVDNAVELMQAQAGEKEIALVYEPAAASLLVDVDQPQLERVLHNLISNAIKYTSRKGTVSVFLHGRNGQAVVEVEDTGYGIPQEELPYIFERFRRVSKHKDKAIGTGLGLAITKAIVEAHAGELSVASEEDVGSKFTVTLPTT